MTEFPEQDLQGEEGKVPTTKQEGTKPSKFGIKKDLQSSAGIPINAPFKLEKRTEFYPNSWEFPIVQLVRVSFDPEKEINRNGDKENVPVLQYVFVTKNGKQFTHIEFPLDEDDAKFEDKASQLQQRIKHIFDATVGANKFKEGSMEGNTIAELFENVANAFNAEKITKGEGELAKTVTLYSQTFVYLKLVYYQTRIQMPMFPNFIQRAFNGPQQLVCELTINPKYDKVEATAPAASGANAQYSGGTNNSFGGGADYGDFPSIP